MVNGAMINVPDLPIPEHLAFTVEKLPVLLLALGEEPVIARACVKARIHPMALELAKNRDPTVAELIEWAMRAGFVHIEERIFVRSMGENKTPKLFEGKPITYIDHETGETTYVYEEHQSDALLKKLAERVRPDLYGDQVSVKVDQRTTVFLPQAEMMGKFEQLLAIQAEKVRQLQAGGAQKLLDRLEQPIEAEFKDIAPEEELAGLT